MLPSSVRAQLRLTQTAGLRPGWTRPATRTVSFSTRSRRSNTRRMARYVRRFAVTSFACDTAVVRRALSAFVVRFHRCSGPMFKIKVASCSHSISDAAHSQKDGLPAFFGAPSPQLSHRRSAPIKRHCGALRPFSVMKMIEIESAVINDLTHALNVVICDMGLELMSQLGAHPSPLTHSPRSSRRSCFRSTNAPISSILVL